VVTFGTVAKRIALCMLAGLVVGALISEASFYFLHTGETRPPQVIELDIPAGTADRIARGQAEPSLPSTLAFVVGDTLTVKNLDVAPHQVGPLLIPSGSQASMRLDSARDYAVACSFEPSKYLGLNVQSPLTPATRLAGILEAGLNLGFLITVYGLFALPLKSTPVST
jgi:hypothetical protein